MHLLLSTALRSKVNLRPMEHQKTLVAIIQDWHVADIKLRSKVTSVRASTIAQNVRISTDGGRKEN